MENALEQAIESIRTGDTENGKRTLARILQANPHNETAWLWMSAVVDSDKRRIHCLERVLEINPANEQARMGLQQLERRQKKEIRSTAKEKEVWINTAGLTQKVVALRDGELIVGVADSEASARIQEYLEEQEASWFGIELTIERRIPYGSIVNVLANQKSDILTIGYTENKKPRSKSIMFWKAEVRDEVFDALANHLEGDFERVTKEFNALKAAIIPGLFLAIAGFSTYFLHQAAVQIVNGQQAPMDSILAMVLYGVLRLLGPVGVIIAGSLIMLVIFVYLVKNVLNPPVYQVLQRKKQ
jgi:hypothetical protein